MLTKMQLLKPLISDLTEVLNESATLPEKKRDLMYVFVSLLSNMNELTVVDAVGVLETASKVVYDRHVKANKINKLTSNDINETLGFIS